MIPRTIIATDPPTRSPRPFSQATHQLMKNKKIRMAMLKEASPNRIIWKWNCNLSGGPN